MEFHPGLDLDIVLPILEQQHPLEQHRQDTDTQDRYGLFNIFSVRRHSVLEHFPRSRVFLRVLFFHSWDFCSMPGNTGNSGNLDHLQRYLHCRQKVHFLGKCFHFVHFEFVISRVTKSAVLWQVDQVVLHLFYLQKPKAYEKNSCRQYLYEKEQFITETLEQSIPISAVCSYHWASLAWLSLCGLWLIFLTNISTARWQYNTIRLLASAIFSYVFKLKYFRVDFWGVFEVFFWLSTSWAQFFHLKSRRNKSLLSDGATSRATWRTTWSRDLTPTTLRWWSAKTGHKVIKIMLN